MNILVTGGSGFIGSFLVEKLIEKVDLVVAGTKDAVLMVESEANGLTEEEMLNAVKFGHEGFVPVIEMIEDLAKECRKPEWTVDKKDLSDVKKKLETMFTDDLKKAFATKDKQDRSNQISEITDEDAFEG